MHAPEPEPTHEPEPTMPGSAAGPRSRRIAPVLLLVVLVGCPAPASTANAVAASAAIPPPTAFFDAFTFTLTQHGITDTLDRYTHFITEDLPEWFRTTDFGLLFYKRSCSTKPRPKYEIDPDGQKYKDQRALLITSRDVRLAGPSGAPGSRGQVVITFSADVEVAAYADVCFRVRKYGAFGPCKDNYTGGCKKTDAWYKFHISYTGGRALRLDFGVDADGLLFVDPVIPRPSVSSDMTVPKGCSYPSVVDWFCDVDKKIEKKVAKTIEDLTRQYRERLTLPQSLPLGDEMTMWYRVNPDGLVFENNEFLRLQATLAVSAILPDGTTAFFDPTGLDVAASPPSDWAPIAELSPGEVGVLISGLRVSSGIVSASAWAASVAGMLSSRVNLTVLDGDLTATSSMSTPTSGILERGRVHMHVSNSTAECTCRDVDADASDCGNAIMDLGVNDLDLRGTVLFRPYDDSTTPPTPPSLFFVFDSVELDAANIDMQAPRLPLPESFLTAMVRRLIEELLPTLNDFLRANGLRAPDFVWPELPNPVLDILPQPLPLNPEHGYAELLSYCSCEPSKGSPYQACSADVAAEACPSHRRSWRRWREDINDPVRSAGRGLSMCPFATSASFFNRVDSVTSTIIEVTFFSCGDCKMVEPGCTSDLVYLTSSEDEDDCLEVSEAAGTGPAVGWYTLFNGTLSALCSDNTCSNCSVVVPLDDVAASDAAPGSRCFPTDVGGSMVASSDFSSGACPAGIGSTDGRDVLLWSQLSPGCDDLPEEFDSRITVLGLVDSNSVCEPCDTDLWCLVQPSSTSLFCTNDECSSESCQITFTGSPPLECLALDSGRHGVIGLASQFESCALGAEPSDEPPPDKDDDDGKLFEMIGFIVGALVVFLVAVVVFCKWHVIQDRIRHFGSHMPDWGDVWDQICYDEKERFMVGSAILVAVGIVISGCTWLWRAPFDHFVKRMFEISQARTTFDVSVAEDIASTWSALGLALHLFAFCLVVLSILAPWFRRSRFEFDAAVAAQNLRWWTQFRQHALIAAVLCVVMSPLLGVMVVPLGQAMEYIPESPDDFLASPDGSDTKEYIEFVAVVGLGMTVFVFLCEKVLMLLLGLQIGMVSMWQLSFYKIVQADNVFKLNLVLLLSMSGLTFAGALPVILWYQLLGLELWWLFMWLISWVGSFLMLMTLCVAWAAICLTLYLIAQLGLSTAIMVGSHRDSVDRSHSISFFVGGIFIAAGIVLFVVSNIRAVEKTKKQEDDHGPPAQPSRGVQSDIILLWGNSSTRWRMVLVVLAVTLFLPLSLAFGLVFSGLWLYRALASRILDNFDGLCSMNVATLALTWKPWLFMTDYFTRFGNHLIGTVLMASVLHTQFGMSPAKDMIASTLETLFEEPFVWSDSEDEAFLDAPCDAYDTSVALAAWFSVASLFCFVVMCVLAGLSVSKLSAPEGHDNKRLVTLVCLRYWAEAAGVLFMIVSLVLPAMPNYVKLSDINEWLFDCADDIDRAVETVLAAVIGFFSGSFILLTLAPLVFAVPSIVFRVARLKFAGDNEIDRRHRGRLRMTLACVAVVSSMILVVVVAGVQLAVGDWVSTSIIAASVVLPSLVIIGYLHTRRYLTLAYFLWLYLWVGSYVCLVVYQVDRFDAFDLSQLKFLGDPVFWTTILAEYFLTNALVLDFFDSFPYDYQDEFDETDGLLTGEWLRLGTYGKVN